MILRIPPTHVSQRRILGCRPQGILPAALLLSVLAALVLIQPAPAATAPAAESTASDTGAGGHEATADNDAAGHEADSHVAAGGHHVPEGYRIPPLWAVLPFAALLLCIAILPLMHKTEHWWEDNRNRLFIALVLSVLTILYYWLIHPGVIDHSTNTMISGFLAVNAMLNHAILAEYIPFIVLLFSLYVISGGIQLKGDLPAHPLTNTIFLAVGAGIASFIGTTGAAMLLIRPLLQTNSERKYVKHTVIFFIFLVCNIGGCLLPIGDPPLFLGYLMGVSFLWTFALWPQWLAAVLILLVIYYLWDSFLYKKETPRDIARDETQVRKLQLRGKVNFLWLIGVVLSVALLIPEKHFLGRENLPIVPNFFREIMQILFVLLSLWTTPKGIRKENKFNYNAIGEVAALFIGIFITMQVPVEILNAKGPTMGLDQPWQFFWATGGLSSFLDNAPTYVVFFKTAGTLPVDGGAVMTGLKTATGAISLELLVAVSLGAVFMGANTYIGNGPNFMVKSIAEQSGIKMPSFFGYMIYSVGILIPIFIALTLGLNFLFGRWLLF
ncbi:MAG: sodium:proton antiporter [Sedimentisphaerales bacterium]|nr:sodium:proton antiporter [Sedimentisphaerales bacterium]